MNEIIFTKNRLHVPSTWTPPITNDTQQNIVNDIQNFQQNILNHVNTPYYPSLVDLRIQHSINSLSSNNDIKIVKSDKNLGLVIMTIQQYRDKILHHLSTTPIYQRIPPFIYHFGCINQLKEDLEFILPMLSLQEKRFLYHNMEIGKPAIFHGLPKLHKTTIWENIKFRPIVAGRPNMAQAKISMIAVNRLELLQKQFDTILQNSFQLVTEMNAMSNQSNIKTMISFDFESLYTNIPLRDLYAVFKAHPKTCRTAPLIQFICDHNYFEFNGSFYHQTDGIAMGTNVAPILANIYLALIIDELINNLPGILLYRRYIDDVLILTDQQDPSYLITQIQDIILPFKAEFTWSQHSVNFLDLKITYVNDHLEYETYQKPINKYLYLPASSKHPSHQLSGFIKGELIRYKRLSSSTDRYDNIKWKFYRRLLHRGYTSDFLHKIFIQDIKHTPKTYPKPILNFIIRYTPHTRLNIFITKLLKKLELSHPKWTFRLVFSKSPNIQQLLMKSALSSKQMRVLQNQQQPLD